MGEKKSKYVAHYLVMDENGKKTNTHELTHTVKQADGSHTVRAYELYKSDFKTLLKTAGSCQTKPSDQIIFETKLVPGVPGFTASPIKLYYITINTASGSISGRFTAVEKSDPKNLIMFVAGGKQKLYVTGASGIFKDMNTFIIVFDDDKGTITGTPNSRKITIKK